VAVEDLADNLVAVHLDLDPFGVGVGALWAPWCGPCRIVEPGVERAAGSLAGRLKVVKVNLDQAPRTAERLGVQGIPTLLLLRHGREVARQVGAVPPPALLRWAEEAITKPAA
jgi:thioredoxin 2